jgi:RND family efflux transporter MFP subunit
VLLSGSAAILAQGVLTAMSMTRWWKVASLLLVAGATVSSTGLLADKGTMAVAAPSQDVSKATAAGPGADMPVAEVKPGKFKLAVVEHGTLEPSRRNDVVAQAEGRTTIKLNLLQNYTKGKTIKELKTEVKKARSDELAKKLRWDLEKEKVVKLERQIELCKIYAPAEGVIQHVNDPNWTPFIQGGAPVRERQLLFHILEPGSPLLVNAKIPEAKIDRVRPGQKARIQVDAFPGAELIGTVKDVFPLPDPTSFFSSNTKVYTTHLTIDNPLPGLRPGMTAKVIQIVERDDALTVPVSAVLRGVGKNHVAVQRSDGGFEWREVVLGDTSGEVVEVKQGLKPGEQVALKPLELVREGVNRDKTLEPTKPR